MEDQIVGHVPEIVPGKSDTQRVSDLWKKARKCIGSTMYVMLL